MTRAKMGRRRAVATALVESGTKLAAEGNPYGHRMIGWGLRLGGVCNCRPPRSDDPYNEVRGLWKCPRCGDVWCVIQSGGGYWAARA